MKKVRTVTLEGLLDSIPVDETLEDKIKRELPLNKKTDTRTLCEYYKVSKNVIYPVLNKLVSEGTLQKGKGNFANRNNVNLFWRVK
jgi:DNA-binding GntR family transcriptional regulator